MQNGWKFDPESESYEKIPFSLMGGGGGVKINQPNPNSDIGMPAQIGLI